MGVADSAAPPLTCGPGALLDSVYMIYWAGGRPLGGPGGRWLQRSWRNTAAVEEQNGALLKNY
jgi:hypothetical protein